MGGHGGLNILPQKSWNVYNRDNRQRVERDEAAAEAAVQEAARVERAARTEEAVGRMRERAGGEAHVQQAHVNFFAAEERAHGNADHKAEQKQEDARLVARVMPDLQLDRSATEPTPWYARGDSSLAALSSRNAMSTVIH